MLEFKDFYHLPQVDGLAEKLAADGPGLVVVAGLDPRAAAGQAADSFLPSGRAAVFGILARRLLAAHPRTRVAVVAESKDAVRLPNGTRGRVSQHLVAPPLGYPELITEARRRGAGLLIVDRLDGESIGPALAAARDGFHVLAQLDCVFAGGAVARHLQDLGAGSELLACLTWVVAVQRLPRLCAACREVSALDPAQQAVLATRYPDLPLAGRFYRAAEGRLPVCPVCGGSGVAGDVAAFDFFRSSGPPPGLFSQPSLLSVEEYALRLALEGQVAIDEVTSLSGGQLRRTYALLSASERALRSANAELQRRLAELESANRVLRQRTESLVSLQEVAHTLISSRALDDLARQVVRQVDHLCGADRAVLYVLRPDATAEIVAVNGWSSELLGHRLPALDAFGAGGPPLAADAGSRPVPFEGPPPGVAYRNADLEGVALRAGLRAPLVAHNEVVGLMVVHATRKAKFAVAEMALLQTFADQAALAIQRAGLIEELREKIVQLEAAQAELVRSERMARELELARQVQQSLLPRVFPSVPGFAFAAHNEPARRVGGDLYDAFRLDDTHFGVAIADVSDKGMPAALFMALTRSLLLAEARREPRAVETGNTSGSGRRRAGPRQAGPADVLHSVHRLLLELGDPEMFVTVFYGVVDTVSRTLTYARAGHERPLLLHAGAAEPLAGAGRFLGLLEGSDPGLEEARIGLGPGDRLVLYTDGLIDALDPDGQAYGIERLTGFLAAHADLPAQDLCMATFAELAAYQGEAEQFDDMALLVVEVQ